MTGKRLWLLVLFLWLMLACVPWSVPGVPKAAPVAPQPGATLVGVIDISEKASSGTISLTISEDGSSITAVGITLADVKCNGFSAGSLTKRVTAHIPVAEGSFMASPAGIGEIAGEFTSPTEAGGTITLILEIPFGGGTCELGSWSWSAKATTAGMPQPSTEAPPTAPPVPTPTVAPSIPAYQCRIAYVQDDDIYVRNCDGSGVRRLTNHPATDVSPSWSPDGQRLVFHSDRGSQPDSQGRRPPSLYLVDADGSNLTLLTAEAQMPCWSPDGSRIAFHQWGGHLAVIDPDGSNLEVILPGSDELVVDVPVWSPDGQRLAFSSWLPESEPGHYCIIYVVNADGSDLRKLARFQAGWTFLTWSPDGQQIGVEIDGGLRCYMLNANGGGEPVEMSSIPDSWHPWYWPQWGGG